MKKRVILFISCILALGAFTGCSNTNQDSAEATTTQEIATEQTTGSSSSASTTEASSASKDDYDFSSYERRINAVTKKINNAKTSSNAKTNQNRFYNLKQQLDKIENDLDSLDDTFEHSYESGQMTFEVYKNRERSIEKLEDKLDLAEDALENKFGIDD